MRRLLFSSDTLEVPFLFLSCVGTKLCLDLHQAALITSEAATGLWLAAAAALDNVSRHLRNRPPETKHHVTRQVVLAGFNYVWSWGNVTSVEWCASIIHCIFIATLRWLELPGLHPVWPELLNLMHTFRLWWFRLEEVGSSSVVKETKIIILRIGNKNLKKQTLLRDGDVL